MQGKNELSQSVSQQAGNGLRSRFATLWHNTVQLLIAIDQVCNGLLGVAWALAALIPLVPRAAKSWGDESLSSHAHRLAAMGIDWPRKVVDGLFFWQASHCATAYESEKLGRQLPPEMRDAREGTCQN